MRRSLTRADCLALLLLGAAVALFFCKILFSNLILARGDTFFYIYPYWSAAADALRAGRLPLWNPHLFMGAPFLANSQAGTLYPLNWPLWLLFSTPVAASLSIALHLLIAGATTYGFVRHGLRHRPLAAWLAAFLFMLGGYLTAQVEHVNQIQGLAWLPAVFWLLASPPTRGRPWLLGALLGLQLLAGHTQATFITLVGAAVYAAHRSISILRARHRDPVKRLFWSLPLVHLVIAGAVGLLLASAQVLPTIELGRHSVRGGGLPVREALSFSLHPLLVGRALLPGYGETLFTEYVAFLPLSALLLASVGLWSRRRGAAGLALLAAVGLFFALGAANPFYGLLVRVVPGFGLFRAPARWLALYAFGAAGLAAIGVETLLRHPAGVRRRDWLTWATVILILVAWAWLAPQLARVLPSPAESPVRTPAAITAVGWAVEGLVVAGILSTPRLLRPGGRAILLVTVSATVLYIATRPLPFNHPTAPEALHALRPAPAHLLAAARFDDTNPPGRFLSISDIFFEPGDLGELETIYGDQLDADAFYDLLIATKQKEILAPNLPLFFGLPAVDGYDGGVLPLANFVTLQRLLMPSDQVSMDGRLRENLEQIPDGRWLDLFNVRFLLTDKVGDAWSEGIFYDLQHTAHLDADRPTASVAHISPFEATGLGMVLSVPDLPPGTPLLRIVVQFADGREHQTVLEAAGTETVLRSDPQGANLVVRQVDWPQPGIATALSAQVVGETPPSVTVHAVTLVDSRDGAFASLVLSSTGRYRLVHSGDVKIYENLDPLPRAFLVSHATWAPDDATALFRMQAPDFDPRLEVVLSGEGESGSALSGTASGEARIERYRAEEVVLRVEAADPGWLVLTDAFYPGWQATVDGKSVGITRADLYFRALPIEPGEHTVVFSFRPLSVRLGIVGSLAAALLWILTWFTVRRGC